MRVTKMVLSENAPDAGGQAEYLRLLLQEMEAGNVTQPYAESLFTPSVPRVAAVPKYAQHKLFEFLKPETLRKLGKVTAVVYVSGYTPVVGWSYAVGTPVYSEKRASVYAVEFENGERLCALHRSPEGVLDLFQCL